MQEKFHNLENFISLCLNERQQHCTASCAMAVGGFVRVHDGSFGLLRLGTFREKRRSNALRDGLRCQLGMGNSTGQRVHFVPFAKFLNFGLEEVK